MRVISLTEYEVDLVEDLQGDTSGYFGRMLFSLCSASRQESGADEDLAVEEAQKLIDVRVRYYPLQFTYFVSPTKRPGFCNSIGVVFPPKRVFII